jgi:hypothetical protein
MSNGRRLYTYKTLKRLINRLRDDLNNNDFVLLYAYNGTGKTRISMEFKEREKQRNDGVRNTLYFNAFTEDLFHWNNDFDNDTERYLIMNDRSRFFDGFRELALEEKIFAYLSRYADFDFRIDYDNWRIVFRRGDQDFIKVSRGEENIFIWCIYLALCELVIESAEAYNWVKFLYIDDPISSLDDNNAIAVATDLAKLLKSIPTENGQKKIKTVLSSHHGLFFNVIVNELKREKHKKYFLSRDKSSDTYVLQSTDDTPFFHHVAVLSELQKAMETGQLYTYHFNMLRSVLEKTATFFGSDDFSYCVHGIEDETLYARALNLLSHGKYSAYEPREMVPDTKELFNKILSEFLDRYKFELPEIYPEQTTTQGS